MDTFIALFGLVLLIVGDVVTEQLCEPLAITGWRRNQTDCSSAYWCFQGKPVPVRCPDGWVIGSSLKYCVPVGTEEDSCVQTGSRSRETRDVSIPSCKVGSFSVNPASCSKYYECTTSSGTDPKQTTRVERECDYPYLFDVETLKCTSAQDAKCGSSYVPRGPCDYEKNQCKHAHCAPCYVRFPSCTGLGNGMNAWAGRLWTPFYVVCAEGKVAEQGQCKSEKERKVFHPQLKECVDFDDKLVG